MDSLFETLNLWVDGNGFVAIMAAFIWGVFSVILSPCHLAGIPLIVGFIDEQGRLSTRRAFMISLFFALGILVVIALVGAVTALAGRMLGDIGKTGNYIMAAVFLLAGLHLLEVIPAPWNKPGGAGIIGKGLPAAFALGLIFGIALGPCTFAYMAPLLAVAFSSGSNNMQYGILLLAVYGTGHCAVIVAAGTSTELVQKYLNWNEKSHGAVILKKLCGILVIAAGLYAIYRS